MYIETLKERIQNAKAKVEKKQNTIMKKEALIIKKETSIRKLGFDPSADEHEVSKQSTEAFWLMCDIRHLKDDIQRGTSEIEEIKVNIEKYEQQLAHDN